MTTPLPLVLALTGASGAPYGVRLLEILALPDALAASLADWLDADGEPQPQDGAESGYYQGLQPPYLAANRPLGDVAELALVRGFDEAARTRLRAFVTALPRFTPVNVNTASPEVLAAVVGNLDRKSVVGGKIVYLGGGRMI